MRGAADNVLFTMQQNGTPEGMRCRHGRNDMRTNIFKVSTAAIFLSLVSASQALACNWTWLPICSSTSTGGGSTPPAAPAAGAPEIDGAGAFIAIALVMSIAAIVYRRAHR